MKMTFSCLWLVVFAIPAFAADEKPTADKLVGTWKITKSESLPKGATVVFTFAKDGTAKGKIEVMGQKIEHDAKWKLDGDKLTVTSKDGDKEEVVTQTIVKLTADDLIIKDKDGKQDVYSRVKEEKK